MLLRSGIDPCYESLRGYVAGAKNHLSEGGKLLLGTGDSADLRMIDEIARENDYSLKLLRAMDRPLAREEEGKVKDLIYEFVRRG